MRNLSIEDIHTIREEHAILTRNMTFAEYKAELEKDTKPLLDLLKSMKSERKGVAYNPIGASPNMVAEPEFEYKTCKKSFVCH